MRNIVISVSFVFAGLMSASLPAQQVVFLDFDSGTDGTINYTQSMRDSVQSQMEGIYSAWNFTFVQSAPTSGDFSSLTFNSGGPGGVAEQIDLGNLDKNDNAVVNVDGFSQVSTEAQIISASAIIGAHELGHLQGLRHHDSFGPIGSGVNEETTGSPWLPDYQGPTEADETFDHIMASPASVGSSINDVLTPSWFSERSAIKLTHNEQGVTIQETGVSNNTIMDAQSVVMNQMIVPNTIQAGDNAGLGDFDVEALLIEGELDVAGDMDFFSFIGAAGDLMNFEVVSNTIDQRISNVIDPQIRVFDATGALVDYYGVGAFNDDELEGLDSQILDLVLPSDGEYFFEIRAFSGADTGQYEVFFSRFNGPAAIPEPAAAGMAMLLLTGLCCARGRRQRS